MNNPLFELTLTQQLERLSGGRLELKPEYLNPLWQMFNDGGVECEVGEFLHALTRMMKPHRILETGTHLGVSASYFGLALKANGRGHLETIEFLPENHAKAATMIDYLGLSQWVKCWLMDVADFNADGEYDIVFLDTEPQTRFAELVKFFPALKPGGIVMIHDLHPHLGQEENPEHGFAWPYGKVPADMAKLFKSGQLRPVHFRTPRGFTMFYKPAKEDYQWA